MHALRTWALIADGSRAFILENSGRDNDWTKLAGDHIAGQDKPSAGAEHDAMVHYAHMLASHLQEGLDNGAFQDLVIAAPPAMLGALRVQLSEKLKSRIIAEYPNDLTKTPVHEISKHFKPVQLV